MAIILPSGFIITNTDPIDSRITLPNSGSRYALPPANVYSGLTVYQQDVQTTFVLINTGSVSNSSGWQALVSAGSNQFSGSQVITGSLTVTQGITGSLFGTSSLALNNIVTASVLASTITFTKGDSTTFDIVIAQSGSVQSASYATFATTAATASYVAGFNFSGYQISTGSITASVSTDTASMFLIQSASLPFLNIASNSSMTISSDLFIIKGFTSQQPVLTVNGTILNVATHSIDPTGSTTAGNIYFTSGAMYVGLE
jgi:preprotein translocase subunit SecG